MCKKALIQDKGVRESCKIIFNAHAMRELFLHRDRGADGIGCGWMRFF